MNGDQLTAEQRAGVLIDRQLTDVGLWMQNRSEQNLFASQGVAARKVILVARYGRASYLVYVDERAAIEAKPDQSTTAREGRP